MVSDMTGPVSSIAGAILVILFGFLSLGQYDLEVVTSGHLFVFLRFGYMLGVGAVGMLGGALALKRKQYGIYIPAIGAVIGIVGSFIPIGNVIYSGTEYPIPLYSTYIIEFILLGLGTGLIGLNKITVRIGADKALELANTIAERNKIKNILSTYLVENKGKAFTAKVIHKRCIEDTHSDVTISETEKMLYELNLIGKVHVSIKDDVYYYFVP